jgi:hypothetical protein
MTAIVTTNLFLSQIAMLNASISAWFGKDGPGLKEWKEDVHAKSYQEGSADIARVGKDLENTAKGLPFKDEKITHKLGYGQGLRTVTSQGTGNKSGEADSEVGCKLLPTWQFTGAVALKSTRLRIMATRRAKRASE